MSSVLAWKSAGAWNLSHVRNGRRDCAITHTVASIQVAEALKLLTGNLSVDDVRLTTYDIWAQRFHQIDVGRDSMATCPGAGKQI